MTNKYGGINDLPGCDKRVYGLWFQMLRRCYDTTQHERSKGRTYSDCVVCDRWMRLSRFARDITELDGYEEWRTKTGYCLDKDTKNPGNKVYSKANCCFISISENCRDVSKRHPDNLQKALEAHKTKYILEMDGVSLLFDSEKDACAFLGVKRCSVSSSHYRGCKCKGYTVTRAKMEG